MKNKLIISCAISLAIVSCKKNSASDIEMNVIQKNLPSIESMYSFFTNQNTSGKFLIETNTSIGNNSLEIKTIHLNGAFINKNTQEREFGQTNSFDNIELSPTADGGYDKNISWNEGKNLFGKNLSLILRKGSANLVGTADTVINFNGGYVPKLFACTNYFQDGVSDQNMHYVSGTKMRPAFTFNWDKDTLNKNGVFVFIEYDPSTYGNESLSIANPNKASNAILVPDNGSYTLTSDMFEDVPLNARINVQIGRGNFGFIKNTDGTVTDMQMVALTYQQSSFYYKTN